MAKLFAAAGYADVAFVEAQFAPDGDFRHSRSPIPKNLVRWTSRSRKRTPRTRRS